jgi:3-oxoacyl-[acyl-carrier protein] reductase
VSEPARDFAGSVVLVTGASRGLGRAIATAFGAAGARVHVGYARQERAAAEAAAAIDAAGGRSALARFDVADADAVRSAVERIEAEDGALDVVVHAAGVTRDRYFAMSGPEDWDEPIRVNLGGALRVARAAVPSMMTRGRGAIVLVGSVAGDRASPGQAGYAASKGGLLALTRTLAAELAPRGVRVNAVVPGLIAAGMFQRVDRRVVEERTQRIPAGRLGTAEEVAEATLWLASPRSSYVVGHALVVDGGFSL